MEDLLDKKIIGYSHLKSEARIIIDCLKNTEKYRQAGADIPRGMLLVGPPGTGKSLMSKCIIEMSGRQSVIYSKDTSDNKDYADELQQTFKWAIDNEPSIVLLEDLHMVSQFASAQEWSNVQAGIDSCADHDVFVIATSNSMHNFPKSLLRPGRFDLILMVNPPHGATADKIIKHYLRGVNVSADIAESDIRKLIGGSSCAVLESSMRLANIFRVYDGKNEISRDNLIDALMRVHFKLSRSGDDEISDEVKDRIAYHEAGHLVVSETLMPGSIALVSLRLNKEEGRDGITIPSSDITSDIYNDLMTAEVALSGKAALEITFGLDTDGGDEVDLSQAHKYTYNWFKHFVVPYLEDDDNGTSEALLANRDRLVAQKIDELYKDAKRIIHEKHDFYQAVHDILLEQETLLASDIEEIRLRYAK